MHTTGAGGRCRKKFSSDMLVNAKLCKNNNLQAGDRAD